MRYTIVWTVAMLLSTAAIGQVLINERDCDTLGIDNLEFLELLSATPTFPLDGYVAVLLMGQKVVVIPVTSPWI